MLYFFISFHVIATSYVSNYVLVNDSFDGVTCNQFWCLKTMSKSRTVDMYSWVKWGFKVSLDFWHFKILLWNHSILTVDEYKACYPWQIVTNIFAWEGNAQDLPIRKRKKINALPLSYRNLNFVDKTCSFFFLNTEQIL